MPRFRLFVALLVVVALAVLAWRGAQVRSTPPHDTEPRSGPGANAQAERETEHGPENGTQRVDATPPRVLTAPVVVYSDEAQEPNAQILLIGESYLLPLGSGHLVADAVESVAARVGCALAVGTPDRIVLPDCVQLRFGVGELAQPVDHLAVSAHRIQAGTGKRVPARASGIASGITATDEIVDGPVECEAGSTIRVPVPAIVSCVAYRDGQPVAHGRMELVGHRLHDVVEMALRPLDGARVSCSVRCGDLAIVGARVELRDWRTNEHIPPYLRSRLPCAYHAATDGQGVAAFVVPSEGSRFVVSCSAPGYTTVAVSVAIAPGTTSRDVELQVVPAARLEVFVESANAMRHPLLARVVVGDRFSRETNYMVAYDQSTCLDAKGIAMFEDVVVGQQVVASVHYLSSSYERRVDLAPLVAGETRQVIIAVPPICCVRIHRIPGSPIASLRFGQVVAGVPWAWKEVEPTAWPVQLPLEHGFYRLTAHDGIGTQLASVDFKATGEKLDLSIQPTSEFQPLELRVLDSSGTPLPGYRVMVSCAEKTRQLLADGAGLIRVARPSGTFLQIEDPLGGFGRRRLDDKDGRSIDVVVMTAELVLGCQHLELPLPVTLLCHGGNNVGAAIPYRRSVILRSGGSVSVVVPRGRVIVRGWPQSDVMPMHLHADGERTIVELTPIRSSQLLVQGNMIRQGFTLCVSGRWPDGSPLKETVQIEDNGEVLLRERIPYGEVTLTVLNGFEELGSRVLQVDEPFLRVSALDHK
jgi:hypothetical protein